VRAEDIVFSQGYGTRRECLALIRNNKVSFQSPVLQWNTVSVQDDFDPTGGRLRVLDSDLPWLDQVHLLLYKPLDYECSHAPSHHPSVFHLVPEPFIRRGIEIAGRLDADTTGLIVLSTDGQMIHHITSPKKHVPKTYRVTHTSALTDAAIQDLTSGIMLRSEKTPTLPAVVEVISETVTRITIQEGRYHQVKRMFAAIENKVLALHREKIGSQFEIGVLEPGTWRVISPVELADF
jgi:16S rRNA pseudouridine516 synthase